MITFFMLYMYQNVFEIKSWVSFQQNSNDLTIFRAEESLTQQSIEPLKVHLAELETAVEEQLDL